MQFVEGRQLFFSGGVGKGLFAREQCMDLILQVFLDGGVGVVFFVYMGECCVHVVVSVTEHCAVASCQ